MATRERERERERERVPDLLLLLLWVHPLHHSCSLCRVNGLVLHLHGWRLLDGCGRLLVVGHHLKKRGKFNIHATLLTPLVT